MSSVGARRCRPSSPPSLTDALTGLANRRRFEETFERAWKSVGRTAKPLSLLIVDVDHFKRYNDRHGHAVGDEVLRGLARCLIASVHRPDDLVARVGGEEFALLLPDTDEEGTARVAQKVHETAATLGVASVGMVAGVVAVSIGLAVEYGVGQESGDLYRMADAALYEVKGTGRNRTCDASPSRAAPGIDKAAACSVADDPFLKLGTSSCIGSPRQ